MTASRARSNDIGSERENSRIGTRRTAALPADFEWAFPGDFLRAMINRPFEPDKSAGLRRNNHHRFRLIRYI
jgi:hypothetical protein